MSPQIISAHGSRRGGLIGLGKEHLHLDLGLFVEDPDTADAIVWAMASSVRFYNQHSGASSGPNHVRNDLRRSLPNGFDPDCSHHQAISPCARLIALAAAVTSAALAIEEE